MPKEEPYEKSVSALEYILKYLECHVPVGPAYKDALTMLDLQSSLEEKALREENFSGFLHARLQSFKEKDAKKLTDFIAKNYNLESKVDLSPHFYFQFMSRFTEATMQNLVAIVNSGVQVCSERPKAFGRERQTIKLSRFGKKGVGVHVRKRKGRYNFLTIYGLA